MKAKELAKLLLENPDMEVQVDCYVGGCTWDNPYPEHKSYDIDYVSVLNGAMLVIECS